MSTENFLLISRVKSDIIPDDLQTVHERVTYGV
jgi:hypothetical protein